MVEYTVLRSRRKTAGIYILPEGRVEVRCPADFTDEAAAAFVKQKQGWIEKHLQAAAGRRAARAAERTLLLWGEAYPVRTGTEAGFDGKKVTVLPGREEEGIRELCRGLAESRVLPRTMELAGRTGIRPASVRISRARSYWGVCTGKNEIRFSWRLVMLPKDIADYVIVHELAHCREHNHGPGFWSLVEEFVPDWREKRRRLREMEKVILAMGS